MQNETQKEIAGIQSATSRQNTKDQVYAQNEMIAYQQKESTARVASIMENTNLSKQQQVSEIMRQMLTQAQTAGQYFTNFFFQAEDGIRDDLVTGVQTCALPISLSTESPYVPAASRASARSTAASCSS